MSAPAKASATQTRTEKLLRARLEATREKLRRQVRATIDREKQLATLSTFSARLAQAQDRQQVIDVSLDLVRNVMAVEIVFLFTICEDTGAQLLAGSRGLSTRFTAAVRRLDPGQGFNGAVIDSGESVVVNDVCTNERLTRPEVLTEGIRSLAIVPLMARSKIVGTLGVATKTPRTFQPTDVSLLETIGNQIGIAVENCRLYSEQLDAVRRLEISEKKYRLLFENAHDAIWVTDLRGRIVAANKAVARMLGRPSDQLLGRHVCEVFGNDFSGGADRFSRSPAEFGDGVRERRVRRPDGSESILAVATTSVVIDGQTVGYQHVAKDITEERRMQDNLRFYVQQVTNAQEEERRRIARELHDSTAQALIAILHQIENYLESKKGLPMADSRFLWSLQEQINSALQEVRQFSRDLRPSILDDLGLLPALEWLVDELRRHNRIEGKLNVVGPKRRFSPEVELILFRIVQEGLRNIVRHAEATKAEVTLSFGERATKIVIADNGKGLQLPVSVEELPRIGKLGLAGMRERAQLLQGKITIQSGDGRGTRIEVEFPHLEEFAAS